MVIQEMYREECFQALARARLFRLACAKDNQPYVVPVYLVFDQAASDGSYLYGFTTLGRKTEWMRANPRVCVEMEEVAGDEQWLSIVVFGTYEELTDSFEHAPDHQRAVDLLQERAMWWEPGVMVYAAKAHRDRSTPFMPIFYRIKIQQMTGHRCCGIPATDLLPSIATPEVPSRGWLRRLLRRVV